MSQHTPGPWRMTLDEFGDYTIQPQHEELAIAAVVNGEMRRMGGQSGEHEANARLIAAAPDLFAALMGIMSNPGGRCTAEQWRAGIDALAKAEGRND